ncbi:MAG: ROK family protein, partial [Thermoguttaceae bacterium]
MENERLYLGVDIGGTKVQATLVHESGGIFERDRQPTPRSGGPERVLAVIEEVMENVLRQADIRAGDLTAVGVAVPGVVDPDAARIVVTPNMSLTGVAIGAHLEARFHAPVAVGNDGNLGTLGEKWLGSARGARSALGIWVGTGIGAGFVQKGKLWRGARESAGEIGHIVMQIGGPLCGCGNHGCLEALASRTAIERDIRQALDAGRTSILSELNHGDLSVIRSGAIRRALEAQDPLVTEVVRHASEVLGYACLTVRHLLDPGVIVLGGGVIEACSDFMMPIIENIVGSDRLPGAR